VYSERVKLITDGDGADVIMDPVLGTFFNCNLECLGMDSRWVIYGAMGGIKIKEANMLKLMNKRATIHTSTLRNRSDDYKSELIKEMEEYCNPGFDSGELRPIIDKTFDLSHSSEAIQHLQKNLNIGKIVLMNDL
jgi:NADPH:quinone reductase-like Zn-dependent oxidoreductase